MERHQIDEGAVKEMDREIRKVVEEYKNLERKSSNIEELKADARKLEQRLEELRSNEAQLQRRFKELDQEEKHHLRDLDETSNLFSQITRLSAILLIFLEAHLSFI